MRYEEEIICYTKTCYDFADVKKSIFQFHCDLKLLISSTKDTNIQIEAFGNLSKFLVIMTTRLLDFVERACQISRSFSV